MAQVGQRSKYPVWFWPVCVFVLALAVRLAAFGELYHSPFFEVLMGDAQGYDLWAQKIAAGDWKGGDQVFYQAPAYPYFLAVVYKLMGHSPIGVRVIQCVLGALAAVMLLQAGTRFFGRLAGVVAGVIFALYPVAIFYDLTLQKSALDGFFMSMVLWGVSEIYARGRAGGVRYRAEHPHPSPLPEGEGARRGGKAGVGGACGWAAMVGAGTALLVLTRENALVLVPVLSVMLVMYVWGWGAKARAAVLAVFGVAFALVLVPVAARNHAVSGEWVLTTSQAGPNFYIGNHPGADGTYQPLKPGRGTYKYERADAVELAQKATGKELTATEVSDYWMGQSRAYIRENPAEWLGLMGRKGALLVNSVEAGDTEDPYTYADYSWTLRLALLGVSMGTLLGLGMVGVISPGGRGKAVYGVAAIVLVFGASVVAFYVFGRYRFPMAAGLALLAGYGVSRTLDLIAVWLTPAPDVGGETKEGAWARWTLIAALACFMGVWMLARLSLLDRDGIKAVTYNNAATELIEKKEPVRALQLLKRATDLSPQYAQAYSNVGAALEQTAGPAGAALAYAKAVEIMPELSMARLNLARVLIESGQPEKAVEKLQEGIARERDNAALWSMLAKALTRMKKPSEAIAAMEQSAALAPEDADVMNSLGVIQAQNGRMDLAQKSFARAAMLNPKHSSARFNRARALIEIGRSDDAYMELKEHLANYPEDAAAKEMLEKLPGVKR
jgi:Flp pilus assembly protein TadD